MKEILYNYEYLTIEEIEETVVRTKMLIINSKNEILLGYCHKTYQFPGGHLEEGETLIKCLKREIEEETGMIVDIPEESKPFFTIRHYSKNYRGTNKNRCNEIYYYIIKTDETYNLDNIRYDEWEKDGNYELRYINLENVEQVLIDSILDNEQNKVIVEEMLEVIKEYKNIRDGNLGTNKDEDFKRIPMLPEFRVRDIEKSRKFYLELGWEIYNEHPDEKFMLLKMEELYLMLKELTTTEDSWNGYATMDYPLGRGMHLQMEVSDVDKLYKKVIDMNAQMFRKIATNKYRELDKILCCKEFLIFDPDGYLLRFSTTSWIRESN